MNLKKIRVGDLFNVDTGSLVDKMYLHSGSCERISVTSSQNGVIGKYDDSIDIPNIRYYSNFISINFFGKAFYHPGKASVEMKVHVLTLKSGQPFTESLGLYLATQLNNLFGHGKYGYGSQLSSSMLKHDDFYLLIPVTDSGQLDVQYMEQYIKRVEAEYIKRVEVYLATLGYESLDDCKLSSQDLKILSGPDEWGEFKVSVLLQLVHVGWCTNGKFDKLRDTSERQTNEFTLPLVNAKHGNNGIMFYGRKSDWSYTTNAIGVVSNGAVATGDVYFHPYDVSKMWDAYLLQPKNSEWSNNVKVYVATALKKAIKMTFGWENKAVWSKVQRVKIKLPVTPDGKPDYNFMDQYITAIEKKKVLKLKQAMDHKLELYREVSHQN